MAIVNLFSFMKKRILTFLSMFMLIGINTWADTDLATLVKDAAAGSTVTLTENVTLTQTVTIDKDLTLDMAGFNITATNCRAFNITAGDVKIINSGGGTKNITSTHTADDTTFPDESSVIRVGDGTSKADFTETGRTPVSLTIGERVQVTTAYCYGITVFGSKTQETLIVNGNVAVTGNFSAISGNGSTWFKGTTITINPTAKITAQSTNAIYHPQDGVLNVYGTVGSTSNKGGIEAKAGTINVYEGAKINGYKTTTHTANNNGCSTTGYAIAVVNNSAYAGGVKVNIDNLTGEFNYKLGIIDDDEVAADKKGSITINHGNFKSYTPDASFVASGKKLVKGKASSMVVDENTPIVASIGNYDYVSIDNAVSDWGSSTLTLKADVEVVSHAVNGKSQTLDLNGHQWKAIYSEKQNGYTCAFQIFTGSNSKLTINDSKGGGSIVGDDKMTEAIWMGNAAAWKDTNTATLIVNGGKLQGKNYAVAGNGAWKGKTNITINGGELVGQYAIYHPQKNGTLKITGGTLTGSCTALEIRAGQQVDITGGTFVSNATSKKVIANGNGTTVEGYALAISQHTTKLPVNVNITGGTFKGINAVGVVNPQNNATDNIDITVTGGTFEATAADGEALYMGHKGGTLNVSDGKFKGAVKAEEGASLNLLGGSYSVEPDKKLLVDGFTVNKVEGTYPYQVEYKKVSATVDDNTSLKDEDGNDITEAEKEQVTASVNETVTENAAVNDSKPNTEEAISEEDSNTLKTMVEAAAKENGTEAADITTIETSLSINLKSASVNTTDGNIVTKMVFDIKPIAVAFAGDKEIATVTVPNDLITKNIKFRLPVDKKTNNKYVSINHKADGATTEDDLGLFAVQTAESGDKFIELERDNFSEYTMTLSEATSVMTAYKGNSTGINVAMTTEAWDAVLAECPNAVAVVTSDNKAFAEAEGVKNVIVEYTVSKTKVYECPNFVLTDLNDFYSPYDFTAISGSYKRTSNNIGNEAKSYNSVCVPFELKATDLSTTAQILIFSIYDKNNATVGFTEAEGQEIPAGTPCIILENNGTEWNVAFNNTKISGTPANTGSMKGTFIKTSWYGQNEDYLSVKYRKYVPEVGK